MHEEFSSRLKLSCRRWGARKRTQNMRNKKKVEKVNFKLASDDIVVASEEEKKEARNCVINFEQLYQVSLGVVEWRGGGSRATTAGVIKGNLYSSRFIISSTWASVDGKQYPQPWCVHFASFFVVAVLLLLQHSTATLLKQPGRSTQHIWYHQHKISFIIRISFQRRKLHPPEELILVKNENRRMPKKKASWNNEAGNNEAYCEAAPARLVFHFSLCVSSLEH